MKKYLTQLFDLIEKWLPVFVTIHTRPKHADRFFAWSDEISGAPKMAIVVQGGLLLKDNFTLETIKLYKKLFPHVLIIVSTWEGEDPETLMAMERAGAILLTNKKPSDFGQQNINLQLVSSRNGIAKARELGAEYVLKTRSDQRIYAPNAMEFLFGLVNAFPVKEGFVQKKRIAAVSLNSFKYRMYGISDMNIFGHIDDVERYWSAPLDNSNDKTVGPASLPKPLCEVYVATAFLKSIKREVKWNLEDCWQCWADHFVVADKEALDIYWYKYARMREYRYPQYDGIKNNQEMNFKEWLNIYIYRGAHQVPEKQIKEVIL